MKKSRFSEEKIISVLSQAEAGVKVTELVRKNGISEATFYNWKAKDGGLDVSQLRRLKELEKMPAVQTSTSSGVSFALWTRVVSSRPGWFTYHVRDIVTSRGACGTRPTAGDPIAVTTFVVPSKWPSTSLMLNSSRRREPDH